MAFDTSVRAEVQTCSSRLAEAFVFDVWPPC
jgi:hypothetical protein